MYDGLARASLPVLITVHSALLVAMLGTLTAASSRAEASRADTQAPARAPVAKTTRGRVYSAAQAARGEQTYMNTCVSCHPPSTYKGAVFLNWQGRSLGSLLTFLMEKMPKSSPGSLSPKEYTQVMAYLLKINRMPAGSADLPADLATLRGIIINLKPDRPQLSNP